MNSAVLAIILIVIIYWIWLILSFIFVSMYYKRRNSVLSSDRCLELKSHISVQNSNEVHFFTKRDDIIPHGSDYKRLDDGEGPESVDCRRLREEGSDASGKGSWSKLIDLHFWVIYCASCSGFWWSKIPIYPTKTIFFVRSFYIVLGTLMVVTGVVVFVTDRGNVGFNQKGVNGFTIIIAGVTGIGFWMCQLRAWKGFEIIGSFFHRASPVRLVSDVTRMKKRMTLYLVFGIVVMIIVPAFVGYLGNQFNYTFMTPFVVMVPIVIVASVGEYCDCIIRSLCLDLFDTYFGNGGSMSTSLIQCIQKFQRFETVMIHASRALTYIMLDVLFYVVLYVISSAVLTILHAITWVIIVISVINFTMSVLCLLPVANVNRQVVAFRTILVQIVCGSLRENDLIVYCPFMKSAKKLGVSSPDQLLEGKTSAECGRHLEESMNVLRIHEMSSDEDEKEDDMMLSSRLIPGGEQALQMAHAYASSDIQLPLMRSSQHRRLTDEEKSVIDEMLKNVQDRPSGLRVFEALVTKQVIWSILGLIFTYCAFIFQMYVGVSTVR
eukprot:TRINITY_DN28874_c0_g1_i1.p1 TRINITY_DN28874_c0_g1~~TRINITY_DN28874_c0_g1_i1.p1  ORF type:complete len:550 (-),score=114.74 TRINITY_DN28874_c0_g1_i1:144-1793(-)